MNIENAQKLKTGQPVKFPADRGEPAGSGKVTHVSPTVQKNLKGIEFLWVTVLYAGAARSAVWPSNRLM